MFAVSRFFSLTLLGCMTAALLFHLFSYQPEEIAETNSQVVAKEEQAYTQRRKHVRRDLYEGKGLERRHAFYTAEQATMSWHEETKRFEEQLTQFAGTLHEEKGDIHLKSMEANCRYRPMILTCNAVEIVRALPGVEVIEPKMQLKAKKTTWSFPQEKGQPWVLEAEGLQMGMRP